MMNRLRGTSRSIVAGGFWNGALIVVNSTALKKKMTSSEPCEVLLKLCNQAGIRGGMQLALRLTNEVLTKQRG